ncbi:WD repeat-containing protein 47 isoform X6 [Sitodiplosis mosellana]|uniref:WD repeat-containing protein 47 isoform X6 n=1 Tax=Sitodiplosis mosellana TaxID=263140 RepID=UPI0024448206|nr:WD repeat-containing protein 47 isoform X6 [Sitodiplosis mosellana]
MLIHNKRLHPRRPCEPGEHYHGCMLHEMQEQASNVRNSKSPVNRSRTPSYSSSSLATVPRRQRHHSTSSSNSALYSPRTSTPQSPGWKSPLDTPNKRYSMGAFPTTYDQINGLFYDAVDATPSKPSLKSVSSNSDRTKQKSKSTICLNSSLITATETGKPDKRGHTVTFKCYDSPDEIIANLFPGIDDDKEPKYLRKGHGAAQMAKQRSTQKDWSNVVRSSSATGNYAIPSDNRKSQTQPQQQRAYSVCSDNSGSNKDRYRSQSYSIARLYGIERDFQNLCLNQTDNAAKIPNIGTKPTSNGNGINNLMKLNNNSSNGSINETNGKAVNVDEIHHQNDPSRPRFVAVTTLEDVQAVRCAEFHPSGRVYSVGSNSKTFRICEYPSLSEIREEHTTYQPTVLFKRTKHHKGSIYCMAWSPQGDLVATGSNDKTVKLMRYNEVQKQLEGKEIELTMHDGTVRDLCFLEDSTNKTSLLISGGAGDCKIYVTDCATSTPFQALSGHGGHILTLYNWGGAMFVSGSQDKTVRFWDLRTRGCVNTVTPATVPGSRQGSPVTAVCVDPSGRLLVSGHEDSSCVLYDIRGNRPIQCFKPHSSDIRSIRFSPSAYYLLTGGYDNKLVLTDLQGDLTMPLPSVVVAQHTDKVISGRWHPTDFSFLSTSADKTATLWALPPI